MDKTALSFESYPFLEGRKYWIIQLGSIITISYLMFIWWPNGFYCKYLLLYETLRLFSFLNVGCIRVESVFITGTDSSVLIMLNSARWDQVAIFEQEYGHIGGRETNNQHPALDPAMSLYLPINFDLEVGKDLDYVAVSESENKTNIIMEDKLLVLGLLHYCGPKIR